jgi:hypothetical protein
MDETKKLFTQKEINRIFSRIPPKTLRWWGTMDLYGHVAFAMDGRGTHRTYELGNLYQIGIVEELSSLNIPSRNISRVMTKHFRYGMNMTVPIGENKFECPIVDVGKQMDKLLVLTKVLYDFNEPGEKDWRIHDWDSFLSDKSEFSVEELFKGSGVERGRLEGFTISAIMIVDLAAIKKMVNALVP